MLLLLLLLLLAWPWRCLTSTSYSRPRLAATLAHVGLLPLLLLWRLQRGRPVLLQREAGVGSSIRGWWWPG